MGGGNVTSAAHASQTGAQKAVNGTPPPDLARFVSRAPASRLGGRWYSPKDLARELIAAGIQAHEQTIRRRCGLPKGDPLRIETPPGFPGRLYIPEAELARKEESPPQVNDPQRLFFGLLGTAAGFTLSHAASIAAIIASIATAVFMTLSALEKIEARRQRRLDAKAGLPYLK